jgi:C-terminal processing protease CtpA/Prc
MSIKRLRAFSAASCFLMVVSGAHLLLAQTESGNANLISEAESAYSSKNYQHSLEMYSKVLAQGAEDASVAYNAACCASLLNRNDRAFQLLDRAVDFGWIKLRHMKRDSDLETLHGDSRWGELLAKVKSHDAMNKRRWQGKAFRSRFHENLTDAEKAAGLSKLWAEVKFNFVNFHMVPDLDWDAEYVAMMPKVLATESTLEYYRLLEQLVAKLNDAHTNVYLPPKLDGEFNARPALRTTLIEDRVIVTKVMDPSVERLGIEVGQELIGVDGCEVKDYAAKNILPYMCASTRQDLAKRVYGYFLLRGDISKAVELELLKPSGEKFKAEVPRKAATNRVASFFANRSAFEMKILEDNIAYVELSSFGSFQALTSFGLAYKEIEKTNGLIIDLRNNGGGNSGVGLGILGFLTDESFKSTKWHTLQYRPTFRAWNRQSLSRHGSAGGTHAPNGVYHYTKPVVMLVGSRTFSAAEDMAAAFDMMKRGKIIGQSTGGSTGQPLMFDLPGGGRARVCTKHDSYADGTEFVGIGIQPDIEVELTVEDLRNGVDRTLETAKSYLANPSR